MKKILSLVVALVLVMAAVSALAEGSKTGADIPVATVAINGGANAGLLAAKILATSDAELLDKLKAYSKKLEAEVKAKDAKLQEVGYKNYKKD